MKNGMRWCLAGLIAGCAVVAGCGGTDEAATGVAGQSLETAAPEGRLPPRCDTECPPCPPGRFCPASACRIVCDPGYCVTDSDCHLVSNYCGGCYCEASTSPGGTVKCPPGDVVQCLVDPCRNQTAICDQTTGRCGVGSHEAQEALLG
jgi:hypothetical protein